MEIIRKLGGHKICLNISDSSYCIITSGKNITIDEISKDELMSLNDSEFNLTIMDNYCC